MNDDTILFPDAAQITIDYLIGALDDRNDDTPVVSRIPTPFVGDLVRVFRTGGTVTAALPVADQAQLTVETYSDDEARAHDLAQLVRALLHAMQGTAQSGVAVYAVNEFSGPQGLPDPVTEKPRFTFTIQVSVRGAAA